MTDPTAGRVAATLAGIKERNERVIALCDMAPAVVRQLAEHDVPRLLAAFEELLKDHAVVQLYEAADGCGHPEPAADTDEHDRWAGDHSFGTTGERICLLSPFDIACDMCSEMVYGEEPTTEDYVSANGCHVREAITTALAGTAPRLASGQAEELRASLDEYTDGKETGDGG